MATKTTHKAKAPKVIVDTVKEPTTPVATINPQAPVNK